MTLQIKRTKVLPDYFRIYPEDVGVLSTSIESVLRNEPSDTPYRFYFAYVKFGQQMTTISAASQIDLSAIVSAPEQIVASSLHVAATFQHRSQHLSLFWDLRKQTCLYSGRDVKKYPFFGFSEVGNVTVKTPDSREFAKAWPLSCRSDIKLTYVQYYTPFTKPFSKVPFQDHPFLLTLLLGKDYVHNNALFRQLCDSTEREADFLSLKESIILHLFRARARCEIVVSSHRLSSLCKIDLGAFAELVTRWSLLVQVCVLLCCCCL